jgi:hypothetical protein
VTKLSGHPLNYVASEAIRGAVDIVEAEPHLALTLASLAGRRGISSRALHQGFVSHMGISPMAYLRQVRLRGTPGAACVQAVSRNSRLHRQAMGLFQPRAVCGCSRCPIRGITCRYPTSGRPTVMTEFAASAHTRRMS